MASTNQHGNFYGVAPPVTAPGRPRHPQHLASSCYGPASAERDADMPGVTGGSGTEPCPPPAPAREERDSEVQVITMRPRKYRCGMPGVTGGSGTKPWPPPAPAREERDSEVRVITMRPRKYRCGKCGFFPKSTVHDCRAVLAAGASTSTAVGQKKHNTSTAVGKKKHNRTRMDPDTGKKYRCGKCGFLPKSTRHDCRAVLAAGASTSDAALAADASTSDAALATEASTSDAAGTAGTPMDPIRNHRCGKCGFFPKSTEHDCLAVLDAGASTSTAAGPAAADPRSQLKRKFKEATPEATGGIPMVVTPMVVTPIGVTPMEPDMAQSRNRNPGPQRHPPRAMATPGNQEQQATVTRVNMLDVPQGQAVQVVPVLDASASADKAFAGGSAVKVLHRCWVCSDPGPDFEGALPRFAGCGCRRRLAGAGDDVGMAHVACLSGIATISGASADRTAYYACPACQCDYTGNFQL